MRIVRKLSRKKFFDVVMYEYEWFLVPVPSKYSDAVHPWHGVDMKVFVEPLREGFAMLVCRENRWHMGRTLSESFRRAARQAIKATAKMMASEDKDIRVFAVNATIKLGDMALVLTTRSGRAG